MQGRALTRAIWRTPELWVTHSQFIVEHINAMTAAGATAHDADAPDLAQRYLQSCEIALAEMSATSGV